MISVDIIWFPPGFLNERIMVLMSITGM
eukprot:SAG22_NODE_7559_length_728_cov_3.513514_2_plen_27_part_01